MRIGLNLLFLHPYRAAGLFSYTLGLLNGFSSVNQDVELVVFTSSTTRDFLLSQGFNWEYHTLNMKSKTSLNRLVHEQILLPILASRLKLDLLHSLAYWGPIIHRGRSVITVPDLNAISIPDSVRSQTRLLWRFLVGNSLRRASHVITISNFSKQEIVRYFGLSEGSVTVTLLAAQPSIHDANRSDLAAVVSNYGIRSSYILSVASSYPHKNLRGLLKAYAILVQINPGCPNLVLVGNTRNTHRSFSSLIHSLGLSGRIHLTGFVPSDHLEALYRHATLFVFPSLYEGFGIPVLEAMGYGTPVVLSDAASLPEVGGTAAVYVDATDPARMADVIHKVLMDDALKNDMIVRGFENLKRFSWVQTALETIDVYRRVVNNG